MDYVAVIVTLIGMVLAGRRSRWCWHVCVAAEALWLLYARSIGSGGLALLSMMFVGVYAYNAWRWRKRVVTPRAVELDKWRELVRHDGTKNDHVAIDDKGLRNVYEYHIDLGCGDDRSVAQAVTLYPSTSSVLAPPRVAVAPKERTR